MEAAQDHQPDLELLHEALADLARDRSLERLVEITAKQWPDYDRDTIEDAVSATVEHAYTACQARNRLGVWYWLERDVRYRLLKIARTGDAENRLHQRIAALEPTPETRPGALDDISRQANAALASTLLSDFSARDQNILRLGWGEGLTRAQIAAELDVGESTVKHTLRRGGRRLQSELCAHLGGGCGGRGEQHVLAATFRRGGEEDAAAHISTCEPCSALHAKLEQIRLGVASLTPAPVAAKPGAIARAGDRLAGAVDWGRDQVFGLYTRAHELAAAPPPVKPGAMLASLGACAAAAGGSYCIDQALPPIAALTQPADKPSAATRPAAKKPADPQSAAAAPAPATPTPEPTPAPAPASAKPAAPAPTPKPPPPSQAAPSPAAPQPDFQIERSQPVAPRTPTPAPAQGGGEFF